MYRKFIFASALSLAALSFTACSDDESDILPGPPDYELEEQPTEGAFILKLQGKVDDGTMEGEYANMVYVDLSAKQQQLVDRTSWNLGFYSGEESRVTLNQSLSRAYSTGKVDFAAVSIVDAENENFPDISAGMMNYPADEVISDNPNGDLNETVFGELATDVNKSEVFLVASEGQNKDKWLKVKVTAVENGYHVLYGNINDTQAKQVTVAKDPARLIVAFSLETGKVVDIPQHWDLMWSKSIALTTMPNGKRILGPSSDVVTSNRLGGVEVAEVHVDNPQLIRETFEAFTKAGVANLEFKNNADALGTDWRLTPMPNAIAPGPRADRFYVFKDAEGNYFKLRFIHFCEEDGGERGKPELEAAPLL